MTVRLVISDVDGTLVTHEKELRSTTVDAVRRLRAAGVAFTIISARPPSGLLPLAVPLGLSEPLGAFNGGTLCGANGLVTDRHTVPTEVIRGMFALADESGALPWLFADGLWHVTAVGGDHMERERRSAFQEPILTPDMAPLFDRVDKLTWVSDDEPMLRALTKLTQDLFAGEATIGGSQPYYLDVTHVHANKGDGVATLADALGVDLTDVVVLGDQFNDLPMFERAGLAIAMGQAPEEVKAKAWRTTASNDRDGVAHAIDTILLPMLSAAR